MATARPALNVAVAGRKSKASDYNENFTLMMGYLEDSIGENKDYTNNLLSIYETVNTLATSGTVALSDNSINTITPTGSVTFTLPSITGENVGKYHQILVMLRNTSNYTITLGTTYYFGEAFTVNRTGNYDIIYEYDPVMAHWYVGAVSKG